jgi:predicted nucleic acid-binding protein
VAIADAWGVIQARSRRMGRSIDMMDALIAATAEVYGMTVVTRDTADLAALGIPLLNPWIGR